MSPLLPISIRLFRPQDATQIAQLFHDTVRTINRQDYSLNQVKAWAPDDIYFRDWVKVCTSRFTYVAENVLENGDQKPGIIIGFAELEIDGHIDCFYVHRDYQGCGVGKSLYQAIESQALKLNCDRLYVEASITAKPFFQRQGFTIDQEQEVKVRGEVFKNYRLSKLLGAQGFAP